MTISTPQSISFLQSGDRLSREEFERRYEASPSVHKAELIDGVVYVASPVRHELHGVPVGTLAFWGKSYCWETPGISQGMDSTVRLDLETVVQPDLLLSIRPECGGQADWSRKSFIEGAPELVGEVAASSVSYDLHDKLRAYLRNGVREYLVWRVEDQAVDWFAVEATKFVRREPDASGVIRSTVLPGLWLDVDALLADDGHRLRATLDAGLASPEHAEFVARLSRTEPPSPAPESTGHD